MKHLQRLVLFLALLIGVAPAQQVIPTSPEAARFIRADRETLPADKDFLRGRLGLSAGSLIGEMAISRTPKTLSDAFDTPVMTSPPTLLVTPGSTTTLASSTFYNDGTPGLFSYGPIATTQTGGFERPAGSSSLEWTVSFYCDADIFETLLNGVATSFTISIDGQLIQSTGFTENAGAVLYKLTFADARPRLVQIKGQNLQFGGVFTNGISAKYSCWPAPATARSQIAMVFGDSYTVGIGSSFGISWHQALGRYLGIRTWGEGVGSMGWNSASPNDVVTRVNARMAQFVGTPDVIISAYGYNDAGGDMTALQTNYGLWVDAVRARWPKTPIWTLGPWTPLGTTAGLTNVKTALISGCAAKGTTFVDIEGIVTAGNKQAMTGVDNTHLTPLGHNYLAVRIGGRLINLGLVPIR